MNDIYFAIVCALIIIIISSYHFNRNLEYKLPNTRNFARLNNKIITNENVIVFLLLKIRNGLDSLPDEKVDEIGFELMEAINKCLSNNFSENSKKKIHLQNLLKKHLSKHSEFESEIDCASERDDFDENIEQKKVLDKRFIVFNLINYYIYILQLNLQTFINLDNCL